jgi:hypothetical protein
MPIWHRGKVRGKQVFRQAGITVVIRVEGRKEQENSAVQPKTSVGFSSVLVTEQREILWT